MSEDCLTLNVWTLGECAERTGVRLDSRRGAAHGLEPRKLSMTARPLAKRGLVVVSINYRLGVLGYHGASGA